MKQGLLFEEDFLDRLVGSRLLKSPRNAIVELVANAWDAGATEVKIKWPNKAASIPFSIKDNGHGMTEEQFRKRWCTVLYNRLREQGVTAEFPEDVSLPPRSVFGKNGIGRFAGFYFSSEYFVKTARSGEECIFKVSQNKSSSVPFTIELIEKKPELYHGTCIFADEIRSHSLSAEEARKEIGMRFLTDPNFSVYIDGEKVTFSNIPEHHINEFDIPADGLGMAKLIVIDTQYTDRSTLQHGLAWHVKGRLVGECSWKGLGREALIDGRTIAARRYVFIIKADFLADAVLSDWSGFNQNNEDFQSFCPVAYEKVQEILLEVSEEDRRETFHKAKRLNRKQLEKVSPDGLEKWKNFIEEIQVSCPSIKERDLVRLSGILAKLESAHSQYGLIHRLGEYDSGDFDNLHSLLGDWTIETAKIVLDEIKTRVLLLDKLKQKVVDKKTDEVSELQPLFKKGLWIFGPEFETIEFTSNEGMTSVVQRLFDSKETASRNRPDFAILPDGTAGLYSYPSYDPKTGGEVGVARLVVIELKKPTIKISTDQKNQCWKYVKELYEKGLLGERSQVNCFVLGSTIDSQEVDPRVEKKDRVIIQPLCYDTVIQRAKSRLLNLSDRVKNAPFLKEEVRKILSDYESCKILEECEQQMEFDEDVKEE